MKIVQSVQNLYNSNLAYFEILRKKVDEIVLNNKDPRWHYESRIKMPESFAMKIETGRFDLIQIFEDFFASTVVVKNLSEMKIAESFITKHFNIQFKRPFSPNITYKESFSFPFDDLRIYVSLKDVGIGDLAPNIYDLVFEIQVKTFLQHAWTIATHDLIYKSDKINWAKERVAYQVKAILEQAEVSISGVEELSKVSEISKENKDVKKVNQMITLLTKRWIAEDLPNDKRRLAQNINNFIDAIGIDFKALEAILIKETSAGKGTNTRDLSPYLVIVQSVFNADPVKILKYLRHKKDINKQKILITKELSFPPLTRVASEKLIILV